MNPQSLLLSSGRRLAYSIFGDPVGEPVLFVHGWPSSSTQAVPLDALCRERGIRLIAPDRPGVGGSDFHQGRRLTDWPALVEELMTALKVDRFHVMGVSGGGLYALMLAHAMAHRLLSVHLVSGAPSFWLLGGGGALPLHYAGLYQVRKWFTRLLPAAFDLGSWMSYRVPHWPLLRWMMWLYQCRRDYDAPITHGHYDMVAKSFREAWTGNLDAMLTDGDIYLDELGFKPEHLIKPVHFWHGRKDRNIPLQLAEKMASMLPQPITHWLEDEGHFSIFLLRAGEIFDELKTERGGLKQVGKSPCEK